MDNDEGIQILSILSVSFPDDIPEFITDQNIIEKLKLTKFPRLKCTDFNLFVIESDKMDLKKCKEILTQLDFKFEFDNEVINYFSKIETFNEDTNAYVTYYALCSCIAWILKNDENKSFDGIENLMKVLTSGLRFSNRTRCIAALSYLVRAYAQCPNFNSEVISQVIKSFFSNCGKEYIVFTFSVLNVLAKLSENKDMDNYKEVLSVLASEIHSWKSKINENDVIVVLSGLKEGIKEGILDAIKLFRTFLGCLTPCSALTLFITSVVLPTFCSFYKDIDFNILEYGNVLPKVTNTHFPAYTLDAKPILEKGLLETPSFNYLKLECVDGKEEQCELLKEIITSSITADSILIKLKDFVDVIDSHQQRMNEVAQYCDLLCDMKLTRPQSSIFYQLINSIGFFYVSIDLIHVSELGRTIVLVTKSAGFSGVSHILKSIKAVETQYSILSVIIDNFDSICNDELFSREMVLTVVNVFTSLNAMNQTTAGERDEKIENALCRIYNMISKIIKIPELANFWMSFSEFNSLFISTIIDDLLRPTSMELLTSFLFNEKSVFGVAFPLCISNLFEMINKDLPNQHSLLVGYDLLVVINKYCAKKNTATYLFSDLLPLFKFVVQKLGETDYDYQFFIEILRFVEFNNFRDDIDAGVFQAICKKSKTMNNDKYYDDIQKSLIGIATFNAQDVLIKNGSILTSILMRSRNDDEMIEFIRDVTNIVKYSLYNTIVIKDSKFDEYLLSLVSDIAYDKNDRFKLIDSIFNFLSIVHCRTASASIVSKYIGLICPLEGKYAHPCIKAILNQISGIVTMSNSEPICFIPLTNKSPKIELKPKDIDQFPESFIVCILAFIEPFGNSNFETLVSLADDKGTNIYIGIENKQLVFCVTNKDKTEKCSIKKVPIGRWTWINTSVVADEQGLQMNVLGWHNKPVTFKGYQQVSGNNITVTFGSNSSRQTNIPTAYISAGEIIKIDAPTPNCNHFNFNTLLESQEKIIVGFSFRDTNKRLDPMPINADVRIIGSSIAPSTSFASIFEHIIGISFLLIVMIELDMPTPTNQMVMKLEFSLLDALTTLLAGNAVFQEDFLNSKCCEILNYLLGKCNSSHITIELFNKILLFQRSVQNEALSQRILTELILDIDIWRTANIEHYLKISKIWLSLFNSNTKECFFSVIPIAYLLQEIKVLSSSNEPIVNSIIANLSLLAAKEVLYDDTSYNFICLIGEIISSTDVNTIRLSVCILQIILSSDELPRSHVYERQDCFFLLQNVLAIDDDTIFLMIVDCIIFGHVKKIIQTLPLQYHLSLLKRMILPSVMNIQTLILLLLKVSTTSELIPFITSFAHHIGGKAYATCASQISLNSSMSSTENILYLAEIYAKVDEKYQEEFFAFLDNYVPNAFSILQVGEIIGIDLMASKYAIHIATKAPKEKKAAMLKQLLTYILFTSSKEIERNNIKMFSDTPFEYKKYKNLKSQLEERILGSSKTEITFSFFPRINDGRWVDEDIAITILTNYSREELEACSAYKDLAIITLVRSGNPQANEFLPLLSKNVGIDSALLLAQCSCGKRRNDNLAISNYTKTLKVIESIVPSTVDEIKEILSYMSTFITNQEKSVTESVQMTRADSFIDGYINALNEHLSVRSDQISRYKEYWNDLFREMTQEHTPWYKSFVPESERSFHQMRDDIIVHNVHPKLIRNLDFDDHLLASTIRDAGGQKEAQELLKSRNIRNKAKAKKPVSEVVEPMFTTNKEERSTSHKSFECQIIFVTGTKKCSMEVYDKLIKLQAEGFHQVIENEDIALIALRNYLQKPTAIEIFLKSNVSFFLNFEAYHPNDIFKALDQRTFKSVISSKPLKFSMQNNKELTNKWVQGKMTNFDYLMELNKASGRSFNDTAQYPFLPWILSNYASENETIDFDDESIYRDLSKPIGALNEKRLGMLKATADARNSGLPDDQWYLYQTGPICPMQVFGYLVRMEPFTSQHIEFQGGKFDKTSRIFKSIELTYKMCTTHLQCFYELIPEFFTSPEFLVNFEHYDLGTGDNGDVKLPKWAKTPFDFIYLNRKALESDYASETLNKWIDLIWGVNQNGAKAKECNNVFDPAMYESSWNSINENDVNDLPKKIHIETTLKEVGQIPPQLFSEEHKKRNMKEIKALRSRRLVNDYVNLQLIDDDVIFGYSSFTADQDHIKVTLITSDKVQYVFKIPLDSSSSSDSLHQYSLEEKQSLFDGTNILMNSSGSIVNSGTDYVISVDERGTTIISENVKTKAIVKTKPLFGEIAKIAADKNFVISCCNDGTAQIWNFNKFTAPLFVVKTYGDEIVSCSIDSSFDLAVIGTESGSIHYISLRHRSISKTITLNEGKDRNVIIKDIKISPGWGFVLVYSFIKATEKYELSLYSLNGEFIRKCEVAEEILDIALWTDEKGFDYCAFSTIKCKVYSFELFYLSPPEKKTYWGVCMISKVECIPSLGLLACIEKRGSVALVNYL